MSIIKKYLRIADNSQMTGYREVAESGTANQFVITDLEEDTKYYVDANVLNTRGLATSTQANFTTKDVNYLCFTDVSGMTNTLTLTKIGNPDAISLEVSPDKSNWTAWTETNGVRSYTIPANGKVYVRGNNETIGERVGNEYIFSSTENINASGSIMTMLDKTDTLRMISHTACFCRIFRNMSTLQTAPELPATEINSDTIHVYLNAFTGTSIRKAPKLPATTIGDNCYAYMFSDCRNLTDVSEIDITLSNVTTQSMYSMFQGCTSLTTAPKIRINSFAGGGIQNCYRMFYGCTSLTSAENLRLEAPNLTENCYKEMFRDCTSLTTTPSLPATTLADYCYESMFYGCTALTSAPSLPATTLADYCYKSMFRVCTSLTTAPSLPATTLASSCYESMFYGCNALTTAPSLPAQTLANGCYNHMFYSCSSLTTAPSLPAQTLASYCYRYMFQNCTSLTTAPSLPATTLSTYCYQYMFYGCTNLLTCYIYATTLASQCFSYMFYNCTRMNLISVKHTTAWSTSYTQDWTYGLPSTGTFKCPASLPKTKNASGNVTNANFIPYNWTIDDNKTNNPQITATRTQSSIHGQVWTITITPPDYGSRTPVTTYYVVSRDGRNPTTTSTNFQSVNGTPYTFDITIITGDFGKRYAKCYSVVSGMADSDIVTHTFTT